MKASSMRRLVRVARGEGGGYLDRAPARRPQYVECAVTGPISAKLAGGKKLHEGPETPVTFIVTAYNIEDYIDRALSSVVDQGIEGAEIIVIDDGSSDSTFVRACRFLKGEPKCRVIAQENAGPGAARNVGVAQASGDCILYLDGDDWLAPGAARALLNAAEKTKADIVLSNRRRYWDRTGNYTTKAMFTAEQVGKPESIERILNVIAIHGKLFRRQFLVRNQIEFPVGMTSEDFVFSYHTYALAKTVATLPLVTYFYRKRHDPENRSITQGRLTETNLTSRFRQIELPQALVAEHRMSDRFPDTSLVRIDYDMRLMRHLHSLPGADADTRARALDLVRGFLETHREAALASVRKPTRDIYELILAGRDEEAMPLIADSYAKAQAAKAKS